MNAAEVATETIGAMINNAPDNHKMCLYAMIIILILFIVTVVCLYKYTEKVHSKSIEQVANAYKETIQNQQKTIEELAKLLINRRRS